MVMEAIVISSIVFSLPMESGSCVFCSYMHSWNKCGLGNIIKLVAHTVLIRLSCIGITCHKLGVVSVVGWLNEVIDTISKIYYSLGIINMIAIWHDIAVLKVLHLPVILWSLFSSVCYYLHVLCGIGLLLPGIFCCYYLILLVSLLEV